MNRTHTRNLARFTLPAIAVVALTACGGSSDRQPAGPGSTTSADDVASEVQDAANTAADYASDQYAAFKATMNEQIATVNAKIRTLKDKAAEMEASARTEINAAIASLESQRDALAQRLEDAADTTGDAWSDVQSGLQSAWDELKTATDEAIDRFDG